MTFNASPPDFVNLLAAFCASPPADSARSTCSRALAASSLQPPEDQRNVLGEPLQECGCAPLTGWFRDGYCQGDPADFGRHTVCCVVNESFLNYSRAQGNDLSTPVPAHSFPGLQAGDHWCVCAARWLEAYEDGMAPPVRLESSAIATLEVIPLEVLRAHAA
ncbi:DUF2237 domain-containing protein [Cyanobium sp. Cruz-8D1]|nr:DUF2237 domain-containing protein [Cyanobium sp. Cruz-8H5]MCP9865615.1 DUF2237 domain-containing protein [Cyanobium sp. Cruz-8D1]